METPSVSPFQDLNDASVYREPLPRTDVGGTTSSDAQVFWDTVTTSVSDAEEPQAIAHSILNPLDLSFPNAIVIDAFVPDMMRPRCRAGQVYLPAPASTDPCFYARAHSDEGREVPVDWCPDDSRPFPNNFFTQALKEPTCTECSCTLTEDDCGIAPLFCNIEAQPTNCTGADNLGAALGFPACY